MKAKKSKKIKKTKPKLFQKVSFNHKSLETVVLVFVCAVVLIISSFASRKFLYNYSLKNESALSSKPEIQIVKNVLAAESQKDENTAKTEVGMSSEVNKYSNAIIEVTLEEANMSKDRADKEAAAKKIIVRQRAAEIALINSSPVLAGPTTRLPDGKRTCSLSHPQPSGRGGKPHIDEDCCADYDEYPNPRCEYSPSQMAALKTP